jgi:hypothetical protein
MVLRLAADNPPDTLIAYGAFQRHIVALSRRRREKHFRSTGPNTLSHRFAGRFDQGTRASPFRMNAGGIAEVSAHGRQNSVDYFIIDGGGSSVVKVNPGHDRR